MVSIVGTVIVVYSASGSMSAACPDSSQGAHLPLQEWMTL